jgi:hypothetical protein
LCPYLDLFVAIETTAWGRIGKDVKGLCQEMTFDDPGASMDCTRKRAHTEKARVGSERVKIRRGPDEV